jgi:hypothetical protein
MENKQKKWHPATKPLNIQWRREDSPRRRIIKKEIKVVCSDENYLTRGA